MPGDFALAFGVFMAVYGGYSTPLIFASSIAGGCAGAITSLLIGSYINRKYDSVKLGNILKKLIADSDEKIKKATDMINKYGLLIIILNRFIPVLRGPIVFAAGYSRVNFFKALIGAVISAFLFNISITIVAFIAGRNFETIKSFLSIYFEAFIILVIIIFVIYKIISGFKRRSA
ncbi:MAG: VTT domain-containing protein [Deltaproteobacteria bacterium]|nr:VTT domain-containing protein [Deltaproteobacteria bacterium]